jgi:membrane protein implicated in regulation of membrane protease activity
MIEEFLFSGNVWLIIGLVLAIIELTNGTLIVFLHMGVSGLFTGLLLKLQENGTLSNLIDSWSSALIFWAVVSLALSFLLNFIVKKKQVTKDVNDY